MQHLWGTGSQPMVGNNKLHHSKQGSVTIYGFYPYFYFSYFWMILFSGFHSKCSRTKFMHWDKLISFPLYFHVNKNTCIAFQLNFRWFTFIQLEVKTHLTVSNAAGIFSSAIITLMLGFWDASKKNDCIGRFHRFNEADNLINFYAKFRCTIYVSSPKLKRWLGGSRNWHFEKWSRGDMFF
jgi:hypothetical protein